jgi:hypothetical protein
MGYVYTRKEFADGEVILVDDLPGDAIYTNLDWDDDDVSGDVECTIDVNDTITCEADGPVTFEPGDTFEVSVDVTTEEIGTLTNPRDSGNCRADPDDVSGDVDLDNNDCNDGVGDTVTVLPDLPGIVVTRGSCTFDLNDEDDDDRQFRIIFTPGNSTTIYKLNATNPGQMFVNVFYTGEEGEVDIELPYPFVTMGATPVHVYDELPSVSTNKKTCYGPNGAGGGQQKTISLYDYDDQAFGETATLTVDVPEGFSHIRVHVDYGLKNKVFGCTRAALDATECSGEVDAIPNDQDYDFAAFDGADELLGEETLWSRNEFKRNPGIGGSALFAQDGDPVAGETVEIWLDGKKVGVTKTDDDGWFMAEFKHKGRAATYTVKLLGFGVQKTASVKANGFVLVDFNIGETLVDDPLDDGGDTGGGDPTPPPACQPKGKGNNCK